MEVTMVAAGLLGLLMIVLGLRVSAVRRRERISLGDGGSPALIARMRAHANCVETVPIALVLMLLVEDSRALGTWLPLLAAVLVLARVLHPIGMERPAPNAARVFGMIGTWTVTGILAIAALVEGFQRLAH